MPVDREWVTRNLGLKHGFAEAAVALSAQAAVDDDARIAELMDFDSESADGQAFMVAATLSAGLSQFQPIPWPKGLDPRPAKPPAGVSLPNCDVLIVTWTVDEGHALSRVLTPGSDSRDDWLPYTKNFAAIAAQMGPLAPALAAKRLGTYWTTEIGGKKVVLFKSDSHMSRDGTHVPMPNATVWKQIIEDCQPKLVITTGTGGGIGDTEEVGDVIVSRHAVFDCRKASNAYINGKAYTSATPVPAGKFRTAKRLFSTNSQFLPKDNTRPPRIIQRHTKKTGIVTTDFFGFDTTDDHYKLQGLGSLSEMGDAVLGMVCDELGANAPPYVIVRNVSDPQIDSNGSTLREQADMAGQIYKAFGRWSTVCSAIVCWAIVAAS
jgi:nucleoside phosphorylase